MNFEVGDKVLCINDKNWKNTTLIYPKCGEIYTIRQIGKIAGTEDVVIFLEEIHNPILPGDTHEIPFYAYRFTKFDPDTIEDELLEEILIEEIDKMLQTEEGSRKIEELLEA